MEQQQQQQQYPVLMELLGEAMAANDMKGGGGSHSQSATMLPKPVLLLSCSAEEKASSTSVSNQSSGRSVEMESSSAEEDRGGSVNTPSDAESEMASENPEICATTTPSGGSVGGSTGKLEGDDDDDDVNEGGCSMEEKGDESGWSELEVSDQGSDEEEEERENNERAIVKEVRSAATTWTDDKHSSYLNSMEATFVRNLYGTKNSQPIDDAEEDCADSHLMSTFNCCTSTPSEFFELLQGGCYQQRAFYRPHTLEPPIPSAPAVFASPWIQHFNVKVAMGANGTCPVGPSTAEHSLAKLCPAPEGTNEIDGNKHKQSGTKEVEEDRVAAVDEETRGIEELNPVMVDGSTDVPLTGQHLRVWQIQQKSHGKSLATVSLRQGARSPGQKRPLELQLGDGDTFLAKKSKTRDLARKDLEMLELYVAGQKDQSGHAQATTICPQPEQPEQDAADLQSSEPKTLLQVTGDANAVKTSTLLSLDESIEVYQNQGDLQRHVGKNHGSDQVVPLLKEVEIPHTKGYNKTVTAVDGTSHRTESTVSSLCITSQTTINSESLVLKVSGEELVEPQGLSDSAAAAAAAKELPLREGGSDAAPFCAGKNLGDHPHKGHDTLDHGCSDMKVLLGKFKQGLQEVAECRSMQGGEVGEAEECEADYSVFKSSKARTWTWGLEGPRCRVHKPGQS